MAPNPRVRVVVTVGGPPAGPIQVSIAAGAMNLLDVTGVVDLERTGRCVIATAFDRASGAGVAIAGRRITSITMVVPSGAGSDRAIIIGVRLNIARIEVGD